MYVHSRALLALLLRRSAVPLCAADLSALVVIDSPIRTFVSSAMAEDPCLDPMASKATEGAVKNMCSGQVMYTCLLCSTTLASVGRSSDSVEHSLRLICASSLQWESSDITDRSVILTLRFDSIDSKPVHASANTSIPASVIFGQ